MSLRKQRIYPAYAKVDLEDVVFFFFGAHGEKCRSDDHSEKYPCEDKIGGPLGDLLLGGLTVSLSNHVLVTERGHPTLGRADTTNVVCA